MHVVPLPVDPAQARSVHADGATRTGLTLRICLGYLDSEAFADRGLPVLFCVHTFQVRGGTHVGEAFGVDWIEAYHLEIDV
jgi:hypothetical protein